MESAPINYDEQTTEELLALLVSEEDRVTEAHIRTLAARPDAVEPLVARLSDEDFLIAAIDGEFWVFYHAFIILSLTRRIELLSVLLPAAKSAEAEEFDWLSEIIPTALAHLGPTAVTPLMEFVRRERDHVPYSDVITFWRHHGIVALTRLALEHPAERARVTDFVLSLYTDVDENDQLLLGFCLDDALTLDRERAIEPLQIAFARNAVDVSICGDFATAIASFDAAPELGLREYREDIFEFYQPDQIAQRQAQWKKEAEEEDDDDDDDDELDLDVLRQILEASPLNRPPALRGFDAYHPTAPAGYKETDDGAFVRASVKVGRNDPCPCGSGKKYKKCCGKDA